MHFLWCDAENILSRSPRQEIASLPIEIVDVGDDLGMTRRAAIYKASYLISYADAFATSKAKKG
jgi:hypothetical protein